MEFRERSLEASSLFLVAEMLECGRYSFNGRKCHPDHIARLRSVASRISLELEEARLRRDIEREEVRSFAGVLHYRGIEIPLTDDRARSSNGKPVESDAVILKRYMELDATVG